MAVTDIGATATIGEPRPDGSVVVTVTPWWSSTPIEHGDPAIVRQDLPSFTIRLHEDWQSAPDLVRADVEAEALAHDETWTKVVPPGVPIESLWRGLELHGFPDT